jgi:hypothetical protein
MDQIKGTARAKLGQSWFQSKRVASPWSRTSGVVAARGRGFVSSLRPNSNDDIFYLFLHKQQIAYRFIPTVYLPLEIEENTCDDAVIMPLCEKKKHHGFLFGTMMFLLFPIGCTECNPR